MFAKNAARALQRSLASSAQQQRGFKVAVLGAGGGIGQPLSLLMKMNPLVTELALYDLAGTPGVAADVGHVNTQSKCKGYLGGEDDQLLEALSGADVVIIPAGVPRKPGMTRDDLFKINAGIVKNLIEGCAAACPGAMINMISNPVNSTVPIAAETLKAKGVYDPKKLFGVTTLDVVRAKTFYAEKAGIPVADVRVPVVGGHAGITILPLLSQASPSASLSDDVIDGLTKRTADGGTEVVAAKAGKGSATLSMAYAGATFADACLRALSGQSDVYEFSYVESPLYADKGVRFFSSEVKIGKAGIEEIKPVGSITPYEQGVLDSMMPELTDSIKKGVDFAN